MEKRVVVKWWQMWFPGISSTLVWFLVAAGKNRYCCFSCWFRSCYGQIGESPRGTEPREMSGCLLKGCLPLSCNEVWNIENGCICSKKFPLGSLNWSLNWPGFTLLELFLARHLVAKATQQICCNISKRIIWCKQQLIIFLNV